MKSRTGLLGSGLLLVALGIVAMLINYDYLAWDLFTNMVDLWPVLLILAGISLVWAKRVAWSMVFLVFLLILVVYYMLFGAPAALNVPLI